MNEAGLKVTGLTTAVDRLKVFDQPQFDRAAQKVLMAAARSLVVPIRQAARSSFAGHGKVPGRLVKSVSARKGIASKPLPAAVVGPRAPYRHLVIDGHRIVGHGGRFGRGGKDTGRRSRANDFVDRGIKGQEARVKLFVQRQLERELKLK
jgi:hypothetical protein